MQLPDTEFDARLAAVRDRLADHGAGAAVFFDATSIEYVVGFHHIQTERPVALAVTADRAELVVPRLEVERVEGSRARPRLDAVHHYFDYPGGARWRRSPGRSRGSASGRCWPTPTARRA